jgi:hypothetical protein
MEHEPPKMGKEHSVRFALAQYEAFSIARWHAVAAHEGRWLKVEPWLHHVRLVNKERVPGHATFDLHIGLDQAFQGRPVAALDQRVARLLEYKAPWQHYVDQLFYESRGGMNDKAYCEKTPRAGRPGRWTRLLRRLLPIALQALRYS